MRRTAAFLIVITILTIVSFQIISRSLWGASSNSAALAGQVSSSEEGSMEGVLVSVTRSGSNVTTTVVSDDHGRFSFPRQRLDPGTYSIRIRAVGYDLDGAQRVAVGTEKTATLTLKLRKTQDLASQLTSEEWLMSMPGTQEQKRFLLSCVNCHTLERIARSHYDANGWMGIYQRMASYAPETSPEHPQKRVGKPEPFGNEEALRKQAAYMATINLSAVDKWTYELKTLPRPTGAGTRVIITEYTLPRPETMPHDVSVDSKGMVWYTDFGRQYLGRLDPSDGKVVEYRVPELKSGFPLGSLDLEQDRAGNFWIGQMLQAGLAKFDTASLKFTTWELPSDVNNDSSQINMVMPRYDQIDGKVWTQDTGSRQLHRLDLTTGKIETFDLFKDQPHGAEGHGVYQVLTDSQNNAYFTDMGGGNIGRVDAKTGEVSLYPTPSPHSGPRRGRMDSGDRLWFGEYTGDKIGMFDTHTKQFREWAAPNPWDAPYDAQLDDHGSAWAAGITSWRVVRLDPKTGQFIEYGLPRYTTIRRVFVDNSTNPVTFWAGNNHGGSIIKLEPLN